MASSLQVFHFVPLILKAFIQINYFLPDTFFTVLPKRLLLVLYLFFFLLTLDAS